MSNTAKKVLAALGVAVAAAAPAFVIGVRYGTSVMCWNECQCEGDCEECLDYDDDEIRNVDDLPGNPEDDK